MPNLIKIQLILNHTKANDLLTNENIVFHNHSSQPIVFAAVANNVQEALYMWSLSFINLPTSAVAAAMGGCHQLLERTRLPINETYFITNMAALSYWNICISTKNVNECFFVINE